MKFKSMFTIYAAVLGICVGLVSGAFLTLVNLLSQLLWETVPASFDLPVYYPIIFGLIGGILVGLFQIYVGDYPKTMEDTMEEFKATKAVKYEKKLAKNFFGAVLVLSFGASLGPEAALACILGGLVTWVGDHLKFTFARREEFLKLGIGAMLATIFNAPLAGISEPLEEEYTSKTRRLKWKKLVLYALTTAFGLVGFSLVEQLVPKETIFKIRIPVIDWTPHAFLLAIPALLVGIAFGCLFLALETFSDKLAEKIQRPLLLAVLAGLLLGSLAMISPYFLFSGEHDLLPLSENYQQMTAGFLLFLAVGKIFLTNLSFAFGWRGGKIFPAIFASAAIGFAFVTLFPYTPGLLTAIIVAASVTVILKQAIVTASLLILLFPLQFFPAILLACFIAQKFSAFWTKAPHEKSV
ncbi:chloride channel protein [Enterococcus devriesei]|uniref:chloride channel protein n=1 Tax=Enterococcus devriesei TaxID=319970 RepID=UPI0036D23444